jgi:hypothetical protein
MSQWQNKQQNKSQTKQNKTRTEKSFQSIKLIACRLSSLRVDKSKKNKPNNSEKTKSRMRKHDTADTIL